jgi:hypothetical protein
VLSSSAQDRAQSSRAPAARSSLSRVKRALPRPCSGRSVRTNSRRPVRDRSFSARPVVRQLTVDEPLTSASDEQQVPRAGPLLRDQCDTPRRSRHPGWCAQRTSSRRPGRRPTRTLLEARATTSSRVRPRGPFRHSSPRVPDSTGIGDYPRRSTRSAPTANHRKVPANRSLLRRSPGAELVDRTQEVGGSSPPSSIATETRSASGFHASGDLFGSAASGGLPASYPQSHPQNHQSCPAAEPARFEHRVGRRASAVDVDAADLRRRRLPHRGRSAALAPCGRPAPRRRRA